MYTGKYRKLVRKTMYSFFYRFLNRVRRYLRYNFKTYFEKTAVFTAEMENKNVYFFIRVG
jgi:hypothetical protein